jgi:NAD(P)-dependent dehydrogenase (short-subunit alcohol dehydrogenase family)
MRLENKIAIITGGGTGIGAATAGLFCREGAQVVLFGRRKDRLEETAGTLGENALVVSGDITSARDVDYLVTKTLEAYGRIDIVVNNAGIFAPAPLHETSDEDWDQSLNINLRGIFLLCKRVLPIMMKQKSGNFIHISSILGIIAVPQTAAYNSSKGALNQLSKSIAVEYGAEGIRSNVICPGLIDTEMTASLMEDEALMEEWSKGYPIGRFGKPDDVASASLYLASDESSFVTGASLPVDGGYTAQ